MPRYWGGGFPSSPCPGFFHNQLRSLKTSMLISHLPPKETDHNYNKSLVYLTYTKLPPTITYTIQHKKRCVLCSCKNGRFFFTLGGPFKFWMQICGIFISCDFGRHCWLVKGTPSRNHLWTQNLSLDSVPLVIRPTQQVEIYLVSLKSLNPRQHKLEHKENLLGVRRFGFWVRVVSPTVVSSIHQMQTTSASPSSQKTWYR